MADLIKDYDAKDADAHLATDGSAILTFLTPDGWVGVMLDRAGLEAFQARISRELSRQVRHVPQH
jgi:hypothetical protein